MNLHSITSPAAIAFYYVALPDPLGVPNGLVFRFQYDEREQPYVAAIGREPNTVADLLKGGGPVDVALQFWQVPTHALADAKAMAATIEVAEVSTGLRERVRNVDFRELLAQRGDRPDSVITVAEVGTFCDRGLEAEVDEPVDLDLNDLTDPLLRSLNCLQHFVRSYRIGTQQLVPEVTYQRFPQHILVAEALGQSDALPVFHDVITLSHKNVREKPPPMLEPMQLSQWLDSVQLLFAGDPAALVQERLLEARRLVEVEGDLAASVFHSALAAETLLDAVLALVLWEQDGGAPRGDGPTGNAAAVLSKPLRSRIRSAYHPLLGGRWDPNRDGAIKDWDVNVARLRGRIVHRGYRPTPDEAAEALNATHALLNYVSERLAAKSRQFPRTAMMILGERGLRERDTWGHIKAFAEDVARREPPWRDNFAAWRDRVDCEVVRRT